MEKEELAKRQFSSFKPYGLVYREKDSCAFTKVDFYTLAECYKYLCEHGDCVYEFFVVRNLERCILGSIGFKFSKIKSVEDESFA